MLSFPREPSHQPLSVSRHGALVKTDTTRTISADSIQVTNPNRMPDTLDESEPRPQSALARRK